MAKEAVKHTEYKNTSKIPLAVINGPTIQPGQTGKISEDSENNPGVKGWIKAKVLVPTDVKTSAKPS